jgi:hypothetical protein
MNSRASIGQFDPADIGGIAAKLAESFDHLCVTSHQYQQVQPAAFRALDLRWYERESTTLLGFGFRLMADVQQDTAAPAGFVPGFLRLLKSADNATQVLLNHAVLQQRMRMRHFFRNWSRDRGRYSVTLSTEFSDGSFCVTSTAPQLYEVEAGFTEQYLPSTLSLQRVVLRHKQLLMRQQQDHPELVLLRAESTDDLLASLNRAQGRRAAARRARGGFTEAELWRLGHSPALARQLVAEMRRQRDLAAVCT